MHTVLHSQYNSLKCSSMLPQRREANTVRCYISRIADVPSPHLISPTILNYLGSFPCIPKKNPDPNPYLFPSFFIVSHLLLPPSPHIFKLYHILHHVGRAITAQTPFFSPGMLPLLWFCLCFKMSSSCFKGKLEIDSCFMCNLTWGEGE